MMGIKNLIKITEMGKNSYDCNLNQNNQFYHPKRTHSLKRQVLRCAVTFSTFVTKLSISQNDLGVTICTLAHKMLDIVS